MASPACEEGERERGREQEQVKEEEEEEEEAREVRGGAGELADTQDALEDDVPEEAVPDKAARARTCRLGEALQHGASIVT